MHYLLKVKVVKNHKEGKKVRIPVPASGMKKLNHHTLPTILILLLQTAKLLSCSCQTPKHCLSWNRQVQSLATEFPYSVMVYLYK